MMEACVLSENWMLLQQALSQVASNLCLYSQATGVVLVSHGYFPISVHPAQATIERILYLPKRRMPPKGMLFC